MLNQVNIPSSVVALHAEAFEPTTRLIREEDIATKQEKSDKTPDAMPVSFQRSKPLVASSVDRNIPISAQHSDNTFVVVIGNE